jgi:N-acetylneuraminic acid mutarotase
MKKIWFLLIVNCQLSIVNFSSAQGFWTQKASFPGRNRDFPFSFSIGNKGYVGCGQDTVPDVVNDFWEYDPAANVWTQKANFGGPARWTATAFSIGNKGYAGLGSTHNNATIFKDFWEYDPGLNTWTQKADFGGGNRYVAVGFSIDSMGYAGTGFTNDLWQFNPVANTWVQKANMPVSTSDANSFVIGTNGYVMGGCYNTNLWQYNSITDTWTAKANLPAAGRCDAAAFSINNKGYWSTGELGGSYGKDLWLYDPLTNTWLQKDSFPGIGRDEPAFFVIGCKAYIGIGSHDGFATGIFFDDFWEYTPDSTCSGSLPVAQFVSSDTTFCNEAGKCIHFTDHSIGNPTSWKWMFPGAIPDSSLLQNPDSICYYVPGTYPVTLIVTNVSGTDTLTISPMITLANPPAVPIVIVSHDTLFSSHAAAYQWYYNGSIIAGATDSFYVFSSGGTYSVQISDGNGCNVLSNGFPESVKEIGSSESQFVIYPNPVQEALIIRHLSLRKEVSIEIYDVLGEKVISQPLNQPQTVIDVSHLNDGIYFLRIDSDNQKFVVMHK